MVKMLSHLPLATRYPALALPCTSYDNSIDFHNGNSRCPPQPSGEMSRVGLPKLLLYHLILTSASASDNTHAKWYKDAGLRLNVFYG